MNRLLRGFLATTASASALVACSPGSDTGNVAVFAAASTRVLNDDLQSLTSEDLTFVNAGSSDLVQQLIDGAPADVLITADNATMDRAVRAGVVAEPTVVAENSLVLITPADNPAGISSLSDAASSHSVVACDPQVPCGAATSALLSLNRVALTPASLEHSVTDVLGKVVAGEVDAGFVYATDAAAAGDRVNIIDIPHADEHRNQIVAAVATGASRRDAAQRVVDTLRSEQAAQMWRNHEFLPAR